MPSPTLPPPVVRWGVRVTTGSPGAGGPQAKPSFSYSVTPRSGWLCSGTLAASFDSLPLWVLSATKQAVRPLLSSGWENTEQDVMEHRAQFAYCFDWQKMLPLLKIRELGRHLLPWESIISITCLLAPAQH